MNDFSHEIFTAIATLVREEHGSIAVIGENVSHPAQFPCVAIDEIYNIPSHLDSSSAEMYSAVTYRVQVFCSGESKRAQARAIFKTVSDVCWCMNLIRKTYTTTPDVYNSSVYCITATFEADIRKDGMIFRR